MRNDYLPRSVLFVPADREDALRAALHGPADIVVADLEDTVDPSRKEDARMVVKNVLTNRPTEAKVMVRVNVAGTLDLDRDLETCSGIPLAALVVPKADLAGVRAVGARGHRVVAMIETGAGLLDVERVAQEDVVDGVVVGANDLVADLHLEPLPGRQELLYARSRIAAAAGTFRKWPIDLVYRPLPDGDDLAGEARFGRALGFCGKATLNATEVELLNEVYPERR